MYPRRYSPPSPEWSSLGRAVRWIAFDERLLSLSDDLALPALTENEVDAESLASARKDLLLAVRNGQVKSRGTLCLYDQEGETWLWNNHLQVSGARNWLHVLHGLGRNLPQNGSFISE